MRLLFVSNLFPDSREIYRGLDNATLLHALRDRYDIRVLALRPTLPWRSGQWQPRPEDAVLQPQYLPVRYLPKIGHRWNHRLYARSLRTPLFALHREWPFDAVLVSWLFPDACAISRVLQPKETPFVAIAQGSDVHQYLRMPARRKIICEEMSRASAIITRSAELARLLKEAGIQGERLHPIYNGVDTTRFRPPTPEERAAARLELGIPAGAKVILFVGNLLPVKNPSLLLEAHARLIRETDLQETRLVLVGGGPLEAKLRAQAAAAGTTEKTIFAGRLNADGVAQTMKAADLLALSSHNEGVPNVILEAFCAGLPVVSTNVGGISEVLQPPLHGHLSSVGDRSDFFSSLAKILRNEPEATAIANYGSTYSWSRSAVQYDRIISRVTR